MNPKLKKIAPMLRQTMDELVNPVADVLWTKWKKGEDTPDSHERILFSVFRFAMQVCRVDSRLTKSEVKILREIESVLGNEWRGISMERYSEIIKDLVNINPEYYTELSVPAILEYLQQYDNLKSTHYMEKASVLFWQLANAIVRADGKIKDDEELLLNNLKENLIPYGLQT